MMGLFSPVAGAWQLPGDASPVSWHERKCLSWEEVLVRVVIIRAGLQLAQPPPLMFRLTWDTCKRVVFLAGSLWSSWGPQTELGHVSCL